MQDRSFVLLLPQLLERFLEVEALCHRVGLEVAHGTASDLFWKLQGLRTSGCSEGRRLVSV